MPLGNSPMSKTTRCPACATVFRVVDAQLDAGGGKVRCGRCGATFDALAFAHPGCSPARRTPAGQPATRPSARRRTRHGFDFGPRRTRRKTVGCGGSRRSWRSWAWRRSSPIAIAPRSCLILPGSQTPDRIHLCRARLRDPAAPPRRTSQHRGIRPPGRQRQPERDGAYCHPEKSRRIRPGFSDAGTLAHQRPGSDHREARTGPAGLRPPRSRGPTPASPREANSPIRVYIEAASLRPTGYRLYLFYS